MENEKDNFNLIVAVALGAIAGLLLGGLIWGAQKNKGSFSKHFATLSKVLEQIEGINTQEADDLRERIHNIINTIETNYVGNKE